MSYILDDERPIVVSIDELIGTEDESYDPWDEIIDKIDNGEEL
mgnify:CR=1 FL=1